MKGLSWEKMREGKRHEIWRCGNYEGPGERIRKGLVAKMRRKTYTVRSRRVGNWWAVDVLEVPRVHTQARRLDQVEGMARDAIALLLDVPKNSFDLSIEPVLPRPMQRKVDRVRQLRRKAASTQAQATAASAYTVFELASKAHLTVREIGRILDLSHQRVDQLARRKTAG